MKTIESIIIGTALALGLSTQGCGSETSCEGMNYDVTNAKGSFSTPVYENMSKMNGSAKTYANSEPKCRDNCSYDANEGCCWCPD